VTTQTSPTSVSTEVEVDASAEHAFRVFTEGIGTWWDDDKHILQAPLAEMVFEPYAGGHIIDRGTDGSECQWATVLAYEPPVRVCFSWDINLQWQIEPDPERASEVEITFTELTPGRTRVMLTHRHLDRHGDGWEGMRDAVGSGWSLRGFAKAAQQPFSGVALGKPLPAVTDDTMRSRIAQARPYTMGGAAYHHSLRPSCLRRRRLGARTTQHGTGRSGPAPGRRSRRRRQRHRGLRHLQRRPRHDPPPHGQRPRRARRHLQHRTAPRAGLSRILPPISRNGG
jgi:uncharacterized protein YndB with AHSA1/START domain